MGDDTILQSTTRKTVSMSSEAESPLVLRPTSLKQQTEETVAPCVQLYIWAVA